MLAVILLELHGKPRRKIELQKMIHRNIFMRDITLWVVRSPPCVIFVAFLSTLFPSPVDVFAECLLKIHNNTAMGGILCGDVMSERSKT